MQGNGPDRGGQKLDEDDEWQLYASAGYASAETVAEAEEVEESDKEEWFDGDDLEVNGAPICLLYTLPSPRD